MKKSCVLTQKRGQTAPVVIILIFAFFVLLSLNITKIPSQYFFLFFLSVILFVLAFVKINFALSILIFSMFLSPQLAVGQFAERAVVIRVDDILLIVVFLGWIAKMAVFKELGLLRRTPLNGPIFAYILACVLSTAFMLIEGRGSLNRSFFYFLKYFEYFALYFLVVNNIHDMRQAKQFVFLIICTCFIVSLYGLYAYHSGHSGEYRATAPFETAGGEPNTLAGYLVLLMGLMLGLLFYCESTKVKLGLSAVLLAAGSALIFTLSRSGWLSFIFMYLAFIVLSAKGRALLILGLIFTTALAPLLAPQAVKERISSTFQSGQAYRVMGKRVIVDESGAARINAWSAGLKKLAERPVLGHGIPGAGVIDNQYTRVMIELGLIGFVVFLVLLWNIFQVIWHAFLWTSGDSFSHGLSVGFLAGFLGLLVHSCATATFILIRIMEPFWFLMAIIVLLPDFVKIAEERPGAFQGT